MYICISLQSMKSVSQDVYEKTEGQTDKQTNKQTGEPLSKGDSRTCLIALHIQLPLATLASPILYFILVNSAILTNIPTNIWHFDFILGHGNHKF